jgi:hypothetical protein
MPARPACTRPAVLYFKNEAKMGGVGYQGRILPIERFPLNRIKYRFY